MASPVVIILAAGKGQRFYDSGSTTHKLDALLNGTPVLTHVMRAVQAAGLSWHVVRPRNGTSGMGESIALGVRATKEAQGWLILPGDLPRIQPITLQRVAQALASSPLVVPYYQGRHGHPVGFSQRYYSALVAGGDEKGARDIVRQARLLGEVSELAVDDRGVIDDVDTLADLHAIARYYD